MITSLTNEKVKAWMKLYQRKYRLDAYLILDEESIFAAKTYNCLKTLIYVGEKPFDFNEAFAVSEEVMLKLSKGKKLSFIGIGQKQEGILPLDATRILMLDGLQDPLNIGKILNLAMAFGFDALVAGDDCADLYHEKSVVLAKTALYKIPFIRTDLLKAVADFKAKGFKVYATGLHQNNCRLSDLNLKDKLAIILGNEGSGVSEDLMAASDGILKIDMCNMDSLNVAMAGAITMYNLQND